MITLKEYIEENEIEEKISAEQAFQEGQRHVARNIAFMFGTLTVGFSIGYKDCKRFYLVP